MAKALLFNISGEKEKKLHFLCMQYGVTAMEGRGAEGILSVYDQIQAADRSDEDTEFFAATLESVGEHDKADASLRRAVELNSASPRARAEAYVALAKNAEARGDVETARKYATVVTSLFADEELCAEANKILNAHTEAAK